MSSLGKRWRLPPEAPAGFCAALPDLPPLVCQILYARGLTTAQAVRTFLDGEADHANPFDLPQMGVLVERLRRAIRQQEEIAVYGDYDADGVTALAVLVRALEALGARVRPYIPHRMTEEYGLSRQALARLRQEGVRVVLTVDCGIRSVDEIAYGQALGLDILVTDHHTVPETLPPAVAIVNPKLPGSRYPFCELAGVGVAYRVAQALLRVARRTARRGDAPIPADEESLLDLVALGTVADLVPLTGENRSLVRRGLAQLNASPRAGLQALANVAGLTVGRIDSEDIAFALAPRLNAAGRLDTALRAFELLSTTDAERARPLAEELQAINAERQRLTQELGERAQQSWQAGLQGEGREGGETPPLLFVAGEGYHKGIVGLVASRLTEHHYRPSVVIEIEGEHCRGSARSIPEFHITEALAECQDLLLRFGGHAMAAGFALEARNLDAFRERLLSVARSRLLGMDLVPTIDVDAVCPLGAASWENARALDQLRPFGRGHPEPTFVSHGVQVHDARTVGRGHLKLEVSDGHAVWDAIAFHQGGALGQLAPTLDLAYNLSIRYWQGEARLQLVVRDLRPAGAQRQA
ncbi:MAG TPA: single-stranded-DNA-specific exonuclease RecJ [Anaerolineae bacterium]|nr:single-stranded-DNA-specific exonuclease RecJ [Anaerolineae bacterium]HPL30208.1 single-stranded-DNA-specific exonuclease RecJ [Anaerolineae bacterium]